MLKDAPLVDEQMEQNQPMLHSSIQESASSNHLRDVSNLVDSGCALLSSEGATFNQQRELNLKRSATIISRPFPQQDTRKRPKTDEVLNGGSLCPHEVGSVRLNKKNAQECNTANYAVRSYTQRTSSLKPNDQI